MMAITFPNSAITRAPCLVSNDQGASPTTSPFTFRFVDTYTSGKESRKIPTSSSSTETKGSQVGITICISPGWMFGSMEVPRAELQVQKVLLKRRIKNRSLTALGMDQKSLVSLPSLRPLLLPLLKPKYTPSSRSPIIRGCMIVSRYARRASLKGNWKNAWKNVSTTLSLQVDFSLSGVKNILN